MKLESLDKWVWLLIFGGMFVLMLGLWGADMSAQGNGVSLGATWVGGLMVLVGIVLVFVRARLEPRRGGPAAPKGPR